MIVRASQTNPESWARVECVVETRIAGGRTRITKLPTGLRVAPLHPVRWGNASDWTLPVVYPGAETKDDVACEKLFSFILCNPAVKRTMLVDGLECVTLGNSAVAETLERMVGWRTGRIKFEPDPLERDPDTGLPVGYRAAAEVCSARVVRQNLLEELIEHFDDLPGLVQRPGCTCE